MKIGYLCPYDDLGCGESEARMRYTYLFEKYGHTVIPLNKNGYTFDTNIHGDNLDLDFVISHASTEQKDIVYPDIFTLFFFWCPLVFFPSSMFEDYLLYLNKHDAVVGGYDSKYSLYDIQSTGYFDNIELLPCYASVPKDYVIEPQKNHKRLFHVGMNLRNLSLIKYLQDKNLIDIYGPAKAFGKKVWKDFPAYKGAIAYDGKEIIKKMNEAGIVLALHSKAHNSQGYVSNRIFEAAAAGAVIIADDNKFIRKYFKDSVYYIDIYKTEQEQQEDLITIINDIQNNPEKAYNMAKKAQEIFVNHLALDKQVENCIKYVCKEKERLANINYGIVDVICYVEKPEDIENIKKELNKQTYKNINPIFISDNDTLKDKNIVYGFTYGEAFYNSFKYLKGNYFMFISANNIMHKHHIFKNLDILNKNKDKMFSYSGTYKKIEKNNVIEGYATINSEMIDFSNCINEIKTGLTNKSLIIDLEEKLTENSVVFNKKILENLNIGALCLYNTRHLHLYFLLLSLMENINSCICTHTLSAGIKNKEQLTIYYDRNDITTERFIINIKKSFTKYQVKDSQYVEHNKILLEQKEKLLKKLKRQLLNYKIMHFYSLNSQKVKQKIQNKLKEITQIKNKYNI